MNRHFSPKFWHYGYENEEEVHVFVHGSIYNGVNIYGVFFGYADRRNEAGEVQGFISPERAQLGALVRALEIVKQDRRMLYVHTTSAGIIEKLEKWIPFWRELGFNSFLSEHQMNIDLVRSIAELLQERDRYVTFECVSNPERVPGCELAISLALDGCRDEGDADDCDALCCDATRYTSGANKHLLTTGRF